MAVRTHTSSARLRGSAASLALALATLSAPAMAQIEAGAEPAAADAGDAAPQGEIVVTGSRIARRDVSSVSPLAIVPASEFRLSGSVNVETVLNTLPQVSAASTAFSNNPGTGAATLDLRHLGVTRSLVLVNGRRYMFYDTNQVVDLNTIPSFLIDNVDVVTGGASAVYGSDAIAGVVNFRLRNVDGLEAGAQANLTSRGDLPRYDAHISLGKTFADGRGHITAYGEYYQRGSLFQDARGYSATPLAENAAKTALVFSGSSFVKGGRYSVGATTAVPAGNGLPAVTLPRGVGNFASALGSYYFAPGQSRPYNSATDSYNFAPDTYLAIPQKRYTAGAYGDFQISEAFTPYFEGSFVRNEVNTRLAPTIYAADFTVRTDIPGLSAADRASLLQIDANEASIDAARTARGLAPLYNNPGRVTVSFARRTPEAGYRTASNTFEAYRALGGVKGEIADNLRYDAYYSFAKTTNKQLQTGNVSISAFQSLLNQNLVNPFGDGLLTQTQVDAVSVPTRNRIESELQVASGSISGSIFNLGFGADDVGFAVGAEWRQMKSSYTPDPALSSGDLLGFSAAQPTRGKYNVKELFAELRVPVLSHQPFADRLEFNAAGRYSDYSLDSVGGVWTYAAGGEWAPVSDLTFRGQFQRAIRAPNVEELFGGNVDGVTNATDPCSNRTPANQNATVRALCVATGVPADLVFSPSVQPNNQVAQVTGGNPDLQEERSDTYTLGAILRPRFIPRLVVTADYFNIKVTNLIAQAGGGTNSVLNLCYNVIQDATSAICQSINRNPNNGQMILAPYRVDVRSANIGKLKTSGIDVQLDYSQPLGFTVAGEESRLALNVLGTWTDKFDQTPIADLPGQVNSCAGYYGATCRAPLARYKATTRFTFIGGPLTLTGRWRYLSSVKDDRLLAGTAINAIVVPKVGAQSYFDLAASIEVAQQMTLAFGVNNVADKQPPIIGGSSAEQSNTWPGVYDALGRDFYVSASFKF